MADPARKRPISWLLITCMLVVAIGSAVLVPLARSATTPDMFGYLEIADRLAAGDVWGSVNTYWSPLFAWLLAPLIMIGLEPILAFRVLIAVSAVVAVAPLYAIACRMLDSVQARAAALASVTILLIAWSAQQATPDMLLVPIALGYALALMRAAQEPQARTAFATGAWAGLGYLAKTYFLPFAVVHLSVVCAWRLWFSPFPSRRRWAMVWFWGCVGMACVALPWALVVSLKAQHPMIGTAGAYNMRLVGPDSSSHPMYLGFLPPSDEHSLSAWSDPGALVSNVAPWPGWRRSLGHLVFYVVKPNIVASGKIVMHACLPMLGSCLVLLMALAAPRWRRLALRVAPWLLSILLFIAGYWPLFAAERYIWAAVVLLPVLAAIPLDWALVSIARDDVAAIAALAFVAAGAYFPVCSLERDVDSMGKRECRREVPILPVGARVVSLGGTRHAIEWGHLWSLEACYRSRAQYFGEGGSRPDFSFLDRHHIEYLLVWFPGQGEQVPPDFKRMDPMTGVPWVYRRVVSSEVESRGG